MLLYHIMLLCLPTLAKNFPRCKRVMKEVSLLPFCSCACIVSRENIAG